MTPYRRRLVWRCAAYALVCWGALGGASPAWGQLDAVPVASGFARPLFVTSPPGDARLFVLEQHTALIRIIAGGGVLPAPFLSLAGQITTGNEQGLLGLAFHPNYSSNGFFYVNYTDTAGTTRVVRYQVSANPDVANPASAFEVMNFPQPFSNHNAGMMAFGPDGYLYIATGDGGSSNDPDNRAQTPTDPLGKMLRVDVDGGSPFAVPPSNPFVGLGTHDERIWAVGLRNPWRFSFDRGTGDMYIGDVGQNALEEINYQPSSSGGGENYGWKIMEGFECRGGGTACLPQPSLTLPVWDIAHPLARSITGGYVYRGAEIPHIQGHYFFGDFISAIVRSFRIQGGAAVDEQDWAADLGNIPNIASFGEDAAGELYICSFDGTVYKIVAQDSDNDGLSDFEEADYGTDPDNFDSDFDLLTDAWEVANGYDPLDPLDPAEIPAAGPFGLLAIVGAIAALGSLWLFTPRPGKRDEDDPTPPAGPRK